MIIKWKKVKTLQPFCSICGEQLQGDNSMVNPYKCKCGTWRNSFDNLFDYKLVEEHL